MTPLNLIGSIFFYHVQDPVKLSDSMILHVEY